jgi:PadR family transcriptional regulator, regulatory protein AphA
MLKYALLGFLSYQPLSGYDLETHIRQSTAHFWHARLSQVYMTLRDLEAEGLVTSTLEAQEKRPDRRVYTVTDSGRAALQTWLQEPQTERSPAKDALLLKLFFAAATGKHTILKQLRLQLDLHREQLRLYTEELPPVAQELLSNQTDLSADALMWASVREFGAQYEQMYIHWLETTIQRIESNFPETS